MLLSDKSLKQIRADLLDITPDVVAILDDISSSEQRRADRSANPNNNALASPAAIIEDYLNLILVRKYDSFIKILSVLYDISEAQLEDYSLDVIVNMITEILSDKLLIRFFSPLRRLGLNTLSDS